MKVLLEENETLTQIAYDAGRPPARPPTRPDVFSPIYEAKFSLKKNWLKMEKVAL